MRNTIICLLFPCAMAAMTGAVADSDCEKKEILTITLPEDLTQPPSVDPDRLCVEKNSSFDVAVVGDVDAEAMILFANRTPIENNGVSQYSEKIKKEGKKLKVKDRCDGSCEYKYDVIDAKNPGRPTLDPVIIIER